MMRLFNKKNTTVNNDATVETVVETKEEVTMTMRERFASARAEGHKKGVAVSNKLGYGAGYATETVKCEVSGVAHKIASAINNNDYVASAKDGYCDGRNNAYYDYANRCIKREEKAQTKRDAKAAKVAATEMFDEMFA